MVLKPVAFQNGDFQTVGAGDLDPTVLPSTVVTTDGTHPFTATQGGVAAVADSDLATLGDIKTRAGSLVWQAPVLNLVSSLPGSPTTGDRYILTTTGQINQWNGAAWVTSAPSAGWTTWAVTPAAYYQWVSGTAWQDVSAVINHALLTNLQGGTSAEYYHLTATQNALLNASQASRVALIAPNGGGVIAARQLDGADIQTGIVAPARGGLGVDASSATGYAKWTAGSLSFVTTIPWSSLTGIPSSFTPSAHAITHGSGGTDPVSLDATQITTGHLAAAVGGTGIDGSALSARLFLASPTSSSGAWSARAITPDDVSGATAANQVLMRKPDNSGNYWALATPAYTTVAHNGTPVASRGTINFNDGNNIALSVVDDGSGLNSVTVTIAQASGMSPVVAALVLGG